MARRSKSIRVETIKEAVRDFYGQYNPDFRIVSNFIRKKKTPTLTEEQKTAIWYIKQNLADKTYRNSVIKDLGLSGQ